MRALELRVARLEGAVTGLAPCYVVWLPPETIAAQVRSLGRSNPARSMPQYATGQ